MNKYEKYKNSGVEWLGDIPENWELARLRTYFQERKTKVSDKDFAPLSVTKQGILPQLDNAAKSNDGDNRKLVKKGDFVINSRSDRKGSSGISKLTGSVSLINIVLIPDNINSIFCNYLLKSYSFVEENYKIGHGIVADLWTTRFDEMKNIKIAFPPLSEQDAIAKYLDEKTTNIEQAISQKEKMISLLKEEKQIIIQNAVTKGLNPNAKMKDSGIAFIGEIPEHWEVKRLGVIGYFSKGGGFSKSDLKENGCYAVLYGDIYTKYNFKINSINRYISNKTGENSILINEGDILFSGSGETKEDIGKCVVLNINDKVYAGGDVIIFKQKTQNSNYLGYYLNTEIIKNEKAKVSKGEIVVHIYASKLKDLFVCLPPIEEQKEIVDYIETKLNRIDKIIELQIRQIEKLKELKTTLIDNAVTGKIKVC
jgi:type I restriction enzyme S subunit